MVLRGIVGRLGGKSRLCKEIVTYFPTHEVYVEPFVGGGSIFFQKAPSPMEVINDLDSDVLSIYQDILIVPDEVFQNYKFINDKDLFYKLRDEFPTEPEERLYRNLCLSYLSFGSNRRSFSYTRDRKVFGGYLKRHLKDYKERLKDCKIHNEDYKKVIECYDGEDTFFYLDPPYSERKKSWGYIDCVEVQDVYEALKNIKGKFLLSYDDKPIIREVFKDYFIKEVHTNWSVKGGQGDNKVELLISNYELE